MDALKRPVALACIFGLLPLFLLCAPQLNAYGKVTNENSGVEYTDLQTAIDDANSGDTLKLKGHFNGNFVVNKSLSLIGSHDAELDGNQTGTVLNIGEVGNITVFLEHLTIKNGLAPSGGGILNIATLTLKHVKVENNTATAVYPTAGLLPKTSAELGGGGIANYTLNPLNAQSGPAQLTIIDSTVKNNSALNAGIGGGILSVGNLVPMGPSPTTLSSVYIHDAKIESNTSTASFGGGIALILTTAEITDTEIESNTALHSAGGGLANELGAEATLTKVKFEYNTAGVGAGIDNSGVLIVNRSKIEENNAVLTGGGIQNEATGVATLNYSKVTHNLAGTEGGGIFNATGSSLTLNYTEVEHNTPDNIAP